MSQKAVGTDPQVATTPVSPRTAEKHAAVPAPVVPAPAKPANGEAAASALSTALKGFVATLHKQAERNTDIIDIFARALKELNREVREEKTRREILERRFKESEARVEKLDQMVEALSRQGWVH